MNVLLGSAEAAEALTCYDATTYLNAARGLGAISGATAFAGQVYQADGDSGYYCYQAFVRFDLRNYGGRVDAVSLDLKQVSNFDPFPPGAFILEARQTPSWTSPLDNGEFRTPTELDALTLLGTISLDEDFSDYVAFTPNGSALVDAVEGAFGDYLYVVVFGQKQRLEEPPATDSNPNREAIGLNPAAGDERSLRLDLDYTPTLGSQPAPSGALTVNWPNKALSGSQPAASGSLAMEPGAVFARRGGIQPGRGNARLPLRPRPGSIRTRRDGSA